jgi:hypothetical protein
MNILLDHVDAYPLRAYLPHVPPSPNHRGPFQQSSPKIGAGLGDARNGETPRTVAELSGEAIRMRSTGHACGTAPDSQTQL